MLRKVYLELTSDCNLDCKICYRHQWSTPPANMSREVWQRVAGQITDIPSVATIVLGGMGEPLHSPLFDETIRVFALKQLWVTTNGTLICKLSEEALASIDLMVISVDGMEDGMMAGRGVNLNELLQGIDYINRVKKGKGLENPVIDIQFVLSATNAMEIFPLMDILAHKKIRHLVVSHLMPQDPLQAGDILYKLHGNEQGKQYIHRVRNYSFKRGLRVIFPEMELKTERGCQFVQNDATYITASGLVVPCYRLAHPGREVVFGRPKSLKQYQFGDTAQQSLEEIWNHPQYYRFRQRIFNNHYPSCPDCDLVEGCSLIKDVDFDCNGDEPNCSDCLWARRFISCT